jgi:hypothetical protein
MSELIRTNDNRATIRWKLLTGASALALTAYISSANLAKAEDADRPTVWIELGGQMEMMQGLSSPFTAPFMSFIPTPNPVVVPAAQPYPSGIFVDNQRPARFAFGLEGKIAFQPENSDWIFSAGIRYGRSHANRHVHHQSAAAEHMYTFTYASNVYHATYPLDAAAFVDVEGLSSEKHMVLDFSAGKDVGLGRLGRDGTSTISAGVRIAQFSADSSLSISARPSIGYTGRLGNILAFPTFHQYFLTAHTERDFKGIGPSLSWNASTPLAGNSEHGELTFDWGINGAVLFGRQRAKADHATQAYHLTQHRCIRYRNGHCVGQRSGYPLVYSHGASPPERSRNVTVPNIGAFAGLSFRYIDAKVSIGYRYDTFLSAMDTGIDTAKKSNLTFNGPYASISIGLGD